MKPINLRLASSLCLLASTSPLLRAEDGELPPISSLDALVVTANRSGQTLFEQIQPASVLDGKNLMMNLEPTLGKTLNRQPGVSSTYFGPGASRPVLRGLGDDRVRILQNGTTVTDVSNVSPDHAVSTDPLNVRSVEIVRGPATLLYGPNTIGGVVNVIDDRIAEERFEGTYPTGKFGIRAGSADSMLSESASLTWGHGPLVFHLDAFRRDTEDVDIPGFARSAGLRATDAPGTPQPNGTLPNSFTNSEGAGFGASYVFDKGFIGFSYSGFNSDYGTVGEPDVTIGLEQRRWDLRGAVYEPAEWIREVSFKLGYSDYNHTEYEAGSPGTEFLIEGYNGRVELSHAEAAGFEGTFGVETQSSDFSALGAEAFLPPVQTDINSLFFFEEMELGKTRLQFGARYDNQSSKSETNAAFGAGQDLDFDAFSASAGIVYNPVEDYAVSLSLAYTQRPPTYVELFANGPHVATGTFEVGDTNLGTEDSFSIDLSVRKKTGRVTGSVGGFYYRFNDFISAQPTGAVDPVDGLPIYAFQAIGANFYGGEAEATFHLLAPVEEGTVADTRLDIILRADFVHAENRSTGEPVPRIPPFRTGVALEFATGPWEARIDGEYAARQNRNANFETETDSYFLLGASLSYDVAIGPVDTTFFVKATNLTDEEARQSTSFLKDVAPLAGRGIVLGMNASF